MKIVIDGCVEKLTTRVDNSWVVTFSTQELSGDKVGKLSDLKKQGEFCKLLLSNNNITDEEATLVDSTELKRPSKGKSPSQRLRGVMYVYWQQNHEVNGGDFDAWYETHMENLIDHYKKELV